MPPQPAPKPTVLNQAPILPYNNANPAFNVTFPTDAETPLRASIRCNEDLEALMTFFVSRTAAVLTTSMSFARVMPILRRKGKRPSR